MAANKNASTMRRLGRRAFASGASQPRDDGSWRAAHRIGGYQREAIWFLTFTNAQRKALAGRGPYCPLPTDHAVMQQLAHLERCAGEIGIGGME